MASTVMNETTVATSNAASTEHYAFKESMDAAWDFIKFASSIVNDLDKIDVNMHYADDQQPNLVSLDDKTKTAYALIESKYKTTHLSERLAVRDGNKVQTWIVASFLEVMMPVKTGGSVIFNCFKDGTAEMTVNLGVELK